MLHQFPDRPTAGRPVVNRSIQVRVLVGEPMRRDRLVARTRRFSTGRPEFESPSRHQQRTRSSMDKAPDCGPGRCRFESCRVLQINQRVGEPGRPCLAWNQEIGGSNPPTLTNCPRSSADQSGRLLSGGSGVQVTPRAPTRMVGRAVRQRGANASRPFGSRRFDPCTIRHAGVAQWQSRCLPSRRREFDSRCPLQHRHVRLAAEDTGPSNRMTRVRIPHVAPMRCPFA